MDFSFHVFNSMAPVSMSMALKRLIGDVDTPPVVVCIGSDLAIGDSMGPITGTLLRRKPSQFTGYVYGDLRSPITAKEIKYIKNYLKQTHPKSKIIVVDAAIGDESEIGLLKVSDTPLRPGSGVNKRLGEIGDVSILGIIAKKTTFSYSQLNLTRLNTVYMMADTASKALQNYFSDLISAKSVI